MVGVTSTRWVLPWSGLALALALFAPCQASATVITFDNLTPGSIVTNQYSGVGVSGSLGAQVYREGCNTPGCVDSDPYVISGYYPPFSAPNLLNAMTPSGETSILYHISFIFSSDVTSVGAYIMGASSVTETILSGDTILGQVSTTGANYAYTGITYTKSRKS